MHVREQDTRRVYQCSALLRLELRAFTFAWCPSSVRTISVWPCLAAACSAVASFLVEVVLTSALCSSRSRTAATWPPSAARYLLAQSQHRAHARPS